MGFTGEPTTGNEGGGAGGLIGGLLSLGGSIYEAENQKRNVDKTIEANKQLSEYGYSKDLEMWNLQNQYNSPLAQMERLKAAGLNPNLIYGSGSASSGNASQMPRYNAPTVKYDYKPVVDLPRVLSMYQDFTMRQAQIDNVKAQTQNVHARTASEQMRPDLMRLNKETGEYELAWKQHVLPYQASILSEKARRGPVETAMAYQKFGLMSQESQLKELERLRSGKALEMMSIDQERKAADLLFAQYRNQWMKEGVTSSDNPLLRILVRMMGEAGLQGIFGEVRQGLQPFKYNGQ